MTTFKNIPTNIISGFLGAGKTTAIQSLIKQKPAAQTWAIIVNEFGQIGVDGALLKDSGVAIKEIPGGCLCCVGSQSLSVGLNEIIRRVKPQRIIIEPTGLGHPAKLIESLTGEFYQSVLDLKAIINLLDARQLSDARYYNNETFIDQSNLADVLIGSKLDAYAETDKSAFYDYASAFEPQKLKVAMVEQGLLQLDWLDLPRSTNRRAQSLHLHSHNHEERNQTSQELENENSLWLVVEGHANQFYSVGWKVNSSHIFNQQKLRDFIDDLFRDAQVERVKGLMHTSDGWVAINATKTDKGITKRSQHDASILEVISAAPLDVVSLDRVVKSCINY